jgi:hypothetical protein
MVAISGISNISYGLTITLLVIGCIILAIVAGLNGVWWMPAWQIAIGYLVWRGGRNLNNAIIAGFAIPIACFAVFAVIVGTENMKELSGYSMVAGTIVVFVWAFWPHWQSRD